MSSLSYCLNYNDLGCVGCANSGTTSYVGWAVKFNFIQLTFKPVLKYCRPARIFRVPTESWKVWKKVWSFFSLEKIRFFFSMEKKTIFQA